MHAAHQRSSSFRRYVAAGMHTRELPPSQPQQAAEMRHVRSGDSTVDVERRAGDVGGLITRQEQRSSGHLFSFAKTACTPSTTGTQANAGGSTKRGEAAPTHPWGRAQGGAASSPRCSGTSSAAPFAEVHWTIPHHKCAHGQVRVPATQRPQESRTGTTRSLGSPRCGQGDAGHTQREAAARVGQVVGRRMSIAVATYRAWITANSRDMARTAPLLAVYASCRNRGMVTRINWLAQHATVHAGNTTTCVSHTVAPAGLQRPAGQQRRRC